MMSNRLPESETAVFSWRCQSLEDTEFLSDLGVRAIFQEVPEGREAEVLDLALGFDVYLLTGSPEMDETEMIEAIDRSAHGFAGVVFDIEPNGLEAWSKTDLRTALVDDFCERLETVYAHARERGVEMYVCIPFWYDELGYDAQLERIIQSSDGVCVMNYSRGNEGENIGREVELAARYQKRLWSIYELSPSDGETVQENNTYHNLALAAVTENYAEHFGDTGVGLAYHELESLRLLAD